MRIARWLPVVLLVLTPPGAGRRVQPHRNLVLITLDTLRADHVGAYGAPAGSTPNLDRFASGSTVFEDAESAAPLTLPSHAAILTGRFPSDTIEVDNGVRLDPSWTIAEILRANSFLTAAFVSSYVLDRRWGLDRGFEVYDDQFDAGERPGLRRNGAVTTERAIAWIQRTREERFFAWIHLYDAHSFDNPPAAGPAGLERDYMRRVHCADAQVGRLLDALDALGLRSDSVVVAVADHGEGLGEHGEAGHGILLYEAVTHVPLIVRAPHLGRSASRARGVMRTIDIAPTVLTLLGINPPRPMDGADLTRAIEAGTVTPDLEARSATDYPLRRFGWSPLRALRAGRFKVINGPHPELYDLALDPTEARDLARERPATTSALIAGIHFSTFRQVGRTPPGIDLDARRALASLGYFSGSSIPTSMTDVLRDPKEELRAGRTP